MPGTIHALTKEAITTTQIADGTPITTIVIGVAEVILAVVVAPLAPEVGVAQVAELALAVVAHVEDGIKLIQLKKLISCMLENTGICLG